MIVVIWIIKYGIKSRILVWENKIYREVINRVNWLVNVGVY